MVNLDTHIVVRFLSGKLSRSEENILENDEYGISSMVLWELAKLHKDGKIPFGVEEPEFSKFLKACQIWQIDTAIALAATRLDFRSDPADEIIAATSIVHRVPLLTRDMKLLSSRLIPLALP